jgi:hypothetical protein
MVIENDRNVDQARNIVVSEHNIDMMQLDMMHYKKFPWSKYCRNLSQIHSPHFHQVTYGFVSLINDN